MNRYIILILLTFIMGCSKIETPIVKNIEYKNFPIIIISEGINISDKNLDYVNSKFKEAKIKFTVVKHKIITLPTSKELKHNVYDEYIRLSKIYDTPDTISIWITPVEENICKITPTSISCARTNGFSFIANDVTNNIVVTEFDINNPFIIAHELGHFFGLYHTFEENKFGKDLPSNEDCCIIAGDNICDTPADPGIGYNIYVSYGECEMFYMGYKPMINNIMGYYGVCINKDYEFTQGQIKRIINVTNKLHLNKCY